MAVESTSNLPAWTQAESMQAKDAILSYDLETGVELWRTTLPWGGDTALEWIAWIGGVNDGRLYASRASNLQPAPVQALSVVDGSPLWTSTATTKSASAIS